jgi:hypothetical protein
MSRRLARAGLGLPLVVLALAPVAARAREPDPEVGKSYQVPYRVTQTNHFLVRVRINGKGPFNFLVDTGAPALYIATATARKAGLTPAPNDFWTPVDRLDFEGGAHLSHLKARVEDPFQLVGMNALGLPGASIDGLLGFTVLARFRLELDPTRDQMTWTRLDFEPDEPPVPHGEPAERERERDRGQGRGRGQPPPEVQVMNLFGTLAKVVALLTGGKQPEDQLHPRGFLGIELAEAESAVRVTGVLADSPAARAGVRSGDVLVRVVDRDVRSLKAARDAVAGVRPGDAVPLAVRRGSGAEAEELTLTLTAGEGL